jgi:DNA-binding NarL/FixJ family response regulator
MQTSPTSEEGRAPAVAPRPSTVLVVEDDDETRLYLAEAIEGDGTRYSVSSAGSLAAGLELLESMHPDVLLVDLGLPDGNGLELILRARADSGNTLPLVITVFGDEQSVVSALEAGARGYLLKSEAPEDMRHAVDQVLGGSAPISPGIASHLLRRFQVPQTPEAHEDDPARLTNRERSVLEIIVRGHSNQETADQLGIRRNTVATHIKNIYRKLEVQSRGQVVHEAVRRGLINVDRTN